MNEIKKLTLEELDEIIYKVIDRKTALTISHKDRFKAQLMELIISDFGEYEKYRDQIMEHWTSEYFLGIEGRIYHQENTKLWQMIYDLRQDLEKLKKEIKELKNK